MIINCKCSWQQVALSSFWKEKLPAFPLLYSQMTVNVSDRFKVMCYFYSIGCCAKYLLEKVKIKYIVFLALHFYFFSSINDINKSWMARVYFKQDVPCYNEIGIYSTVGIIQPHNVTYHHHTITNIQPTIVLGLQHIASILFPWMCLC